MYVYYICVCSVAILAQAIDFDMAFEPVEWHRRCFNSGADRLASWQQKLGPIRHLASGWRRLIRGNIILSSDGSLREKDNIGSWSWILCSHDERCGLVILACQAASHSLKEEAGWGLIDHDSDAPKGPQSGRRRSQCFCSTMPASEGDGR